jgi:glucarate dehydratase
VKIVDMRVTPIAMADPPLRSSYGRHQPYALRTIVELLSEDGIVGAAEAHGGALATNDFLRARSAVVGRSAYDLARIQHDLEREYMPAAANRTVSSSPSADTDWTVNRSHTFTLPGEGTIDVPLRVYAAVEVAALDLIGKAVGQPVCELLGGRVRDAVSFSAYLFYKHAGGGGEGDDARPDHYGEALNARSLVGQARQMIAEYGFQSVKLKGGVLPPDEEIETMQALRNALGPEVPLRIDPNCAWSVGTSLHVGRSLSDVLEYLEDPAPEMDGMAGVRHGLLDEGIGTPLASNVVVTSFADVPAAVRSGGVQVILSDHHYWGGPRAITQLGRLCETFGLGLSMHSNSHLGLSLLAMTHVAAATPHLTYACDTHYPWQAASDEILVGGRVRITNGQVHVPTQPGLGAEIDPDALARGHERYQRCGYSRRDDTAEMRKHVDPTWARVVPVW